MQSEDSKEETIQIVFEQVTSPQNPAEVFVTGLVTKLLEAKQQQTSAKTIPIVRKQSSPVWRPPDM